jgi:hypothetical protein
MKVNFKNDSGGAPAAGARRSEMQSHRRFARVRTAGFFVGCAFALGACGGDDTPDGGLEVPARYAYESRFVPGQSSVDYAGQSARQVLMVDLGAFVGGLSGRIDAGTFTPGSEAEVRAALDYYFRFDGASNGDDRFAFTTMPPALQSTWNDISANKQLRDKLAGNDTVTDHVDWSTAFRGWSDPAIAAHGGATTSPEGLLTAFFATLATQSVDQANGMERIATADPSGAPLPAHLTESGLDLEELVQKLLLGAVSFSQGADDYLDSDVAGKGLLSPNTRDGDKPWTVLEHQWDEGFGYWGAARDFGDYTVEERGTEGGRAAYASGYHDTDGDGRIDLTREANFGAAIYAGKRDHGSAASARTDFSGEAFDAFRRGRAIIAAAGETLTDAEISALSVERDRVVGAWERALAASAVHYLNEVLVDMGRFDMPEYVFADHAEHWSELKGLALAFQFNPRSPLDDARFSQLHTLLGDAPVLATATPAERDAYRAKLLEARALLGTAYGFDAANLGADDGTGGW